MSKRSYRRLAVVAGAALAVGSMAPALAQQLEVKVEPTVEVNAGPATLPVESVTTFADDIQAIANLTVNGVPGTAQASVNALIAAVSAFPGFLDNAPAELLTVEHELNLEGNPTVDVNAEIDKIALEEFVLSALAAAAELQAGATAAVEPLAAEVSGAASAATDAASELQGDLETYLNGLLSNPTGVLSGVSAEVNVIASIMASL